MLKIEYGIWIMVNGQWIMDFWETGYNSAASPWSEKARTDYEALFEFLETFKWTPWPKVKAELAEWDKISFKEWMENLNGWDPQVTHLMDMWVRSDFGTGVDTLSTAAGFWNYSGGDGVNYKWPGGMSGFARHLVNALIPEALNGQDVAFESRGLGRFTLGNRNCVFSNFFCRLTRS